MAPRHLFVFEHESPLGNAPAHKLFELVEGENGLRLKDGVETPRSYNDYHVPTADDIRAQLPAGVTVSDKLA